MKITILLTGETNTDYIRIGIEEYLKRLKHYVAVDIVEIPEIRNSKSLSREQYADREAELQEKNLKKSDFVVLLDERGSMLTSLEFSGWIHNRHQAGSRHVVFVTGGPYGFSEKIRKMASAELSLSKMTMTHQMVRLLFIEQLYRAYTILRNEKYHH